MAKAIIIVAMIFNTLYAQTYNIKTNNFGVKLSGVYTWGQVLTMVCEELKCTVVIPPDIVDQKSVFVVNRNTQEAFISDLNKIASSIGAQVTYKGGVLLVKSRKDQLPYISQCGGVQYAPYDEIELYKKADKKNCITKNVIQNVIQDSITKNVIQNVIQDSITKRYTMYNVKYIEFTDDLLRNLGLSWGDVVATGFPVQSTISFIASASLVSDSLYSVRQVQVVLDSFARVHWGTEQKELSRSTIVDGNLIQDYVYREYGITLEFYQKKTDRLDYVIRSPDQSDVVTGTTVLNDTTITSGNYDQISRVENRVPHLSDMPIIGRLFVKRQDKVIRKYFILIVNKILQSK